MTKNGRSRRIMLSDAAGLPDVRIHDLRHTYASLLINNGVSLYEVQELLGHSSSAMTQRYAHLQPKPAAQPDGNRQPARGRWFAVVRAERW